jgi:hypothetical protein
MDNKKFEKLIDLIINENTEQASDLFHDIVVEKSREIYESIMEEEMMDDDMYEEGMGGQVGDLLDEIESEESGMMEDEEDMEAMDDEIDMADADDSFDLGDEDFGDDEGGEEVEDAVIRIEDKLDQLMAEFESIMGGDASMGDEEVEVDSEEDSEEEIMEVSSDLAFRASNAAFGKRNSGPTDDWGKPTAAGEKINQAYKDKADRFGKYGADAIKREKEKEQARMNMSPATMRKLGMSEEEVMEAVQLQKVSVTHGDNGVQTKSPVAANAGQSGMASKPVKASTTTETGRAAPTAKDVDGASKFKNAPGQKKQDLSAAPKPVTKDGSSNDRSPVAK